MKLLQLLLSAWEDRRTLYVLMAFGMLMLSGILVDTFFTDFRLFKALSLGMVAVVVIWFGGWLLLFRGEDKRRQRQFDELAERLGRR